MPRLKPTVHVIVSCTNSKTLSVPDALRYRTFAERGPKQGFRAWSAALDCHPAASTPAWNLYKGDHWHVVRDFGSVGQPVRVWVCSAGYGLVQASDLLKPYAATFSPGHEDSISSDASSLRDWWSDLSAWRPSGSNGPRSFVDAFAQNPSDRWMVVLSAPYLTAVRDDLSRGLGQLELPENLTIVSSQPRGLNGLSKALLPVDERFQSLVTGAKLSLNVRVARWLLQEAKDFDYETLRDLASAALSSLPRPIRHDRQLLTDDQVTQFIKKQLEGSERASASGFLRKLRAEGLACEQSRFSKLFATAVREVQNA